MAQRARTPAHGTPPAQRAEQSGRGFSPADAATRADHEAAQIAMAGPEIPVDTRSGRQFLHIPLREKMSAPDCRACRDQAFAAWTEIERPARGVTASISRKPSLRVRAQVNLTVPLQGVDNWAQVPAGEETENLFLYPLEARVHETGSPVQNA